MYVLALATYYEHWENSEVTNKTRNDKNRVSKYLISERILIFLLISYGIYHISKSNLTPLDRHMMSRCEFILNFC